MTQKDIKKLILEKGALSQEENLRIYNNYYKNWGSDHEYIFKKFNISKDTEILDIGPNWGHNLINFNKNSVGLEVQDKMVEFGKSIGLNMIKGNAEEGINLDRKFDLIWSTDFLVHLISPYKFLYDCHKKLNHKGRIIIQVPLMSIFNTHKSPCHFYAFNKKSLIYLMEQTGYKILKTSGYIRKKPNWLNRLLEPALQIFGGNIWILGEKTEKEVKFDKSFLPNWFKV